MITYFQWTVDRETSPPFFVYIKSGEAGIKKDSLSFLRMDYGARYVQ